MIFQAKSKLNIDQSKKVAITEAIYDLENWNNELIGLLKSVSIEYFCQRIKIVHKTKISFSWKISRSLKVVHLAIEIIDSLMTLNGITLAPSCSFVTHCQFILSNICHYQHNCLSIFLPIHHCPLYSQFIVVICKLIPFFLLVQFACLS